MLHALKNAADEGWNRLISLFVNRGEKEEKIVSHSGESGLILNLLKNLSAALLNTL